MEPSWGQDGAKMGPRGAKMGQDEAKRGPRWGQDGPSWAILGPSWHHLGRPSKNKRKNAPQATKSGRFLSQVFGAKRILAAEIIGFVKKRHFKKKRLKQIQKSLIL